MSPWGLISIVFSIVVQKKIIENRQADVEEEKELDANEKILLIITLLGAPVICGMIYYFTLGEKFPYLTSTILKYAVIAFFAQIIVVIGIFFALWGSFFALSGTLPSF